MTRSTSYISWYSKIEIIEMLPLLNRETIETTTEKNKKKTLNTSDAIWQVQIFNFRIV